MMVQKQRELHNQKKKLAQELPDKCRTYTVNYTQNTLMPHFGDEQPRETYYYSPVNVCTRGVVNCLHGIKPMRRCAHVYFEDKGKKGWKNVASLIYRQLFQDGFLMPDKKKVEELNFVFDNCGCWKKNRMVLCLLLFFVKRGVCDMARAIFLVKGYAKNDCGKMFSLMKQGCGKKNSYTPEDVIKSMLEHSQVTVIRARPFNFHDRGAYEDVCI